MNNEKKEFYSIRTLYSHLSFTVITDMSKILFYLYFILDY